MIDELNCCDVQGYPMEGGSDVTRSIIDELHSPDTEGDQMEGGSMVLLQVSLMNFILRIFKEIKWKMEVMLLEVSLMNFCLRIAKERK